MNNVAAIQLTEGCSTGCPDCGLEAKKGVKEFIPYEFLQKMGSKYGKQLNNNLILYYASDPFDYQDGEHGFFDVHRLFSDSIGAKSTVTTSMPAEKEKMILEHILGFGNSRWPEFNLRISVMKLNRKRITNALSQVLPQFLPGNQIKLKSNYEIGQCELEEGIDEICISENTKAYPLRPVLMNADDICKSLGISENQLYLEGRRERAYFARVKPKGKSGTKLMAYAFALDKLWPCGDGFLYAVRLPNSDVIASESEPVSLSHMINYWNATFGMFRLKQQNYPMEFNVCAIDFSNMQRYRLGAKNKERLSERGIGCFHGVLMTPLGVYNVRTAKPIPEHPTGQILTPIEPDNFKVAAVCRLAHGEYWNGFLKQYREM